MKVNKEEIKNAIDAIFSAFVWRESPQGAEYWNQIILNLEKIRDDPQNFESERCSYCNKELPDDKV